MSPQAVHGVSVGVYDADPPTALGATALGEAVAPSNPANEMVKTAATRTAQRRFTTSLSGQAEVPVRGPPCLLDACVSTETPRPSAVGRTENRCSCGPPAGNV